MFQPSAPLSSRKLLKVNANERLSLKECLEHPWLSEATALRVIFLVEVFQGLVTVPFWEYWTSPEKVAI
jgi:hypothetical protein